MAEELARRYGLPKWQFTLSATHANTEAIRVARALTGRDRSCSSRASTTATSTRCSSSATTAAGSCPRRAGCPRDVTRRTTLVPFNDPEALRAALSRATWPIVHHRAGDDERRRAAAARARLPRRAPRAITRETGTLLGYDETHTQVVGPGGLTRMWDLEPDVVTIGKSIAGGVPLGRVRHDRGGRRASWSDRRAATTRAHGRDRRHAVRQPAVDGGRPRDAWARSSPTEAYAHTHALGARLADGIEKAIAEVGLPWTTHRFWPRSRRHVRADDAAERRRGLRDEGRRAVVTARVYLANRGVWEAIVGAGPTCSVPATEDDVDRYVDAYASLVRELTA